MYANIYPEKKKKNPAKIVKYNSRNRIIVLRMFAGYSLDFSASGLYLVEQQIFSSFFHIRIHINGIFSSPSTKIILKKNFFFHPIFPSFCERLIKLSVNLGGRAY